MDNKIKKNNPATREEIDSFLEQIDFMLPEGFIEFYTATNGAFVYADITYIALWPINEMVQMNLNYQVEDFMPDFFIFGSNGGLESFAIEKKTGYIYNVPFISSGKDAIFVCKKFNELFIE